MLCDALTTYDSSSIYKETSLGAAVAVTKTTDLTLPAECNEKHKYSVWFLEN